MGFVEYCCSGRKLLENYNHTYAEEEAIVIKSSNLVVIMAAMLCALICLLGLFSMVRCAMRCRGRPFVLRSTHRIFFPMAVDRGLDKAALQALPIVDYCKGQSTCGVDCAICLAEFEQGEKLRPLPNCGHCFHVTCIDTWFVSHSSCPTCRGLVSSIAAESDATSAPTLRGIACPLQYWNRNMFDPSIDRYLP